MVKPLPQAIHKPKAKTTPVANQRTGIVLRDNVIWNPANLANGDIVLIGASGSRKTQTLPEFDVKKD